jgi:predicted dehydrogenase
MKTSSHLTRRAFLQKSAATTFGFTILPSYLALGKPDKAGNVPPSQRLNLGCVGVGNRANAVITGLSAEGNATPVAFCDVDFHNSLRAEKTLETYPDVRRFEDFRVMLDTMGDDIDAVSVVTPDQTHFVIALEAMRRGKHVYVEKPLTHTFREAELLMQAEKKYKVVTQMGNQGHTSGGASQFQQMVKGGVARDINKIEAFFKPFKHPGIWFYEPELRIEDYPAAEEMPASLTSWDLWCGPAEMKPFNNLYHPQTWRAFFLYGCGIFGDWGAHILDFAHDYLNLGLPTRVEKLDMLDHNQIIFPRRSQLSMHFPERGKGLPAVDLLWTDGYGVKPEVTEQYWDKQSDGSLKEPTMDDTGSTLMHRKDGKFIIYRGSHGSPSSLLPRVTMQEYREYVKQPTVKQSHFENFVQASMGNGRTTSPFSISGELTQLLHLGVTCQYLNESFDFNRKTKRIIGNARAQAVLDGPEPRKGWKEYYKPIS